MRMGLSNILRRLKTVAIVGLLLTSLPSLAILNSPPDFKYKDGKAVFVDFRTAKYELVIDFQNKQSPVMSTITFYQDKEGYPIFDLVNDIQFAKLDSVKVSVLEIDTPDGATKIRIADKQLKPGIHTLVTMSQFDAFIGTVVQGEDMYFDYDKGYVDAAVYLSDMSDRQFLEIVVATNFEFDAYKMDWDIRIVGGKKHKVLTNGKVNSLGNNHFSVSYPKYFTTSSPFLNILKDDLYSEIDFSIKSISGRDIPVKIYSSEIDVARKIQSEIFNLMAEFERDFGPWPHPELLVKVSDGMSGMEYVGAFFSGSKSVRHEFIHNYFARGIFSTDGVSSWLDESITEWAEKGYGNGDFYYCGTVRNCTLSLDQVPRYIRHTTVSYHVGAYVIDLLDKKLAAQGGMLVFLPYFFRKHMFKGVTTEIFKQELESFFDQDLTPLFNQYVYGR